MTIIRYGLGVHDDRDDHDDHQSHHHQPIPICKTLAGGHLLLRDERMHQLPAWQTNNHPQDHRCHGCHCHHSCHHHRHHQDHHYHQSPNVFRN